MASRPETSAENGMLALSGKGGAGVESGGGSMRMIVQCVEKPNRKGSVSRVKVARERSHSESL